jgi:predicted outer membrane protein
MSVKRGIWQSVAMGLGVLNVLGAGYAAGADEPWHAAIHAVLALAFGSWAQRLRQAPRGDEAQARLDGLEDLEFEVSKLRQELSEAQERLDFAERLLAQGAEVRRDDPRQ